jgi:hypothetical protein
MDGVWVRAALIVEVARRLPLYRAALIGLPPGLNRLNRQCSYFFPPWEEEGERIEEEGVQAVHAS